MAMNLRNQLPLYLAHRGMTAAELSRKAAVSKQLISAWLAGTEPKKIEHVHKVARTLGTTVDHLCFGEGVASNPSFEALAGEEWIEGLFELKLRRVKRG